MNSPLPEKLSAPAHRALASEGIKSLEDLGKFTEGQVLKLHGMGPNAMGKLREAMASAGVKFAEKG